LLRIDLTRRFPQARLGTLGVGGTVDDEQPKPEQQEAVEPPIKQLQDVPPEEWDYSNRQAFAGCGVVGAVLLAILLPPSLAFFIDDDIANLVGFGFSGLLAIGSVAVIIVLTRRKRHVREDAASSAGESSEA
jgi:hypothetical protein